MARALLVCRGAEVGELAAALGARGWQVRATARTPAEAEPIEAAGAEAALADPDRVGSILELLAEVSVLAWLQAGVRDEGELASLHRERLPSLLEKLVDTPVRGLVYEVGEADRGPLLDGQRTAERAAKRWRIPVALLTVPRRQEPSWRRAAIAAIEGVLD